MTSDLVRAGYLRSYGFPVPDNIPDCAEVPRSALHFETATDVKYNDETGAYDFRFYLEFTEPFRWLACTYSAEQKP